MRLWNLTLAAMLAQFALAPVPAASDELRSLKTRFSYTATVQSVPSGTKQLRVWLPIPSDGRFQVVSDLSVTSAFKHEVMREARFENRMVYVRVPAPKGRTTVTVSFDVERWAATRTSRPDLQHPRREMFVRADRLVPIDGRFKEIAREVCGTVADDRGKMWALFQHVLDTMQYDYKRESPMLGEGDVAFVCDYKRGDCSDLHSYLISLSRAMGVPAYLEYGFPISGIPFSDPLPKSGKVGGYHCWTWANVDGEWMPFDASDARKWLDVNDPAKKDLLFGSLQLERSAVAVSRGRDIVLEPAQQGAPLNKFIYPYAEADGKSVEAGWELTFEALD